MRAVIERGPSRTGSVVRTNRLAIGDPSAMAGTRDGSSGERGEREHENELVRGSDAPAR